MKSYRNKVSQDLRNKNAEIMRQNKSYVECNFIVHPNMTEVDFLSEVKSMFDRSDKNKKGFITLKEFKQFSLFILETFHEIPFATEKC